MQAEQAVASRTDSRVATQAEPNVVAVLPPLPLLHLSTSRCRPRQTRVRTTCVHLDQPVPQRGHPDCQSGTSSTCTRPPIPAIPQLLPALKRKHTHTNTRSREKKQQQQRTHPEEEHTCVADSLREPEKGAFVQLLESPNHRPPPEADTDSGSESDDGSDGSELTEDTDGEIDDS
eukprot:COSAG06_NODE_103_length_23904_cov_10.413401_27_plen_175_part_00